jgi:hypothetical protein
LDRTAKIGETGGMYVPAGLLAVLIGVLIYGWWLYRTWSQSSWRTDQAAAVRRIDSLIDRLATLTETPGTGLTVADIGDVRSDWAPLKDDLESRYQFKAWLKTGRKAHTLDDRFAHALWTLAYKKVKHLNSRLDANSDGPMSRETKNLIIDVLSTNLDKIAGNVVRFAVKSDRPDDTTQLKLSS